jgi:predicted phosphodiesterase
LIGGSVGSPKVFRELFLKHPNVRLALSGHNHMLDDCTIDHVTYICGGAVSGAWWGGDYEHFPPAFVIIDLLPNGSAIRQIIYYENKV